MGWAAIVEQRQWLGKAEVQASTLFSDAESETTPSRQPSSPTRVRAQPSPTRPALQPRVPPPAGWAVANYNTNGAPSKSARRKGSPTRKRATTREALAAAEAAQRKGAATRAAASSVLAHGTPSLPLSKLMTHGVLNV